MTGKVKGILMSVILIVIALLILPIVIDGVADVLAPLFGRTRSAEGQVASQAYGSWPGLEVPDQILVRPWLPKGGPARSSGHRPPILSLGARGRERSGGRTARREDLTSSHFVRHPFSRISRAAG